MGLRQGQRRDAAEMRCRPTLSVTPITYMAVARQYIAVPVGGGPLVEALIAVSL